MKLGKMPLLINRLMEYFSWRKVFPPDITKNTPWISRLIEHWKNQGIAITPQTIQEIERIERENSLRLPNDFKAFYQRVNGMEIFYPNDMDDEGFSFYPIEAILSAENEIEGCNLKNKDRIFIFADYLQKSWWYGFEVKDDGSYAIGIIPTDDIFKSIAESLQEFIELYLEDSPKLYDYGELPSKD